MKEIMQSWAQQWGVHPLAIVDLLHRMDVAILPEFTKHKEKAEATVNNTMRLEAANRGIWLMRNNSGAYQDDNGNWVRYGLCNDSKKVNAVAKSSDLIGPRPVLITQAHVGTIIGQFCAREGKPEGWKYTGTDREVAQLNFMKRVIAHGGDACFSTGPGTFDN